MKPRLHVALTILSLTAMIAPGVVRGEVYAELDPSGAFVGTRITAGEDFRHQRIWDTTGAAASPAHVLNPDGARRGDGRPDVAVSPVTGLPRAVWARRDGASFEIASSFFDGRAWSAPTLIHTPNHADDVDPKIAFRSDGVAIVTWWQNGPSPVVRMAYASPGGRWLDAGVISAPGVKAKRPSVRQEGNLTIVAYRTPGDVGIVTLTISSASFADGPTPFPRSGGDPDTGDGPEPTEP